MLAARFSSDSPSVLRMLARHVDNLAHRVSEAGRLTWLWMGRKGRKDSDSTPNGIATSATVWYQHCCCIDQPSRLKVDATIELSRFVVHMSCRCVRAASLCCPEFGWTREGCAGMHDCHRHRRSDMPGAFGPTTRPLLHKSRCPCVKARLPPSLCRPIVRPTTESAKQPAGGRADSR